MNTTEQEIEAVLRHAPAPRPPADLKERLEAQVPGTSIRPPQTVALAGFSPVAWLRRWWPALAPAALSLAGAAMLTLQQMEIRDLRQSIRTLSPETPSAVPAAVVATPRPEPAEPGGAQGREIARLQELTTKLAADVAALERLRADNDKLRAQIAAATAAASGLSADEQSALAQARDRAMSIQCANNMKQLGLAVKVWALDNQDRFPTHVLEMTNEMSTPKILVCPADTSRQAAADWAAYSTANCSYEYLGASASDKEPDQVIFRCPVHGTVGLADGSVQMVSKSHPEFLVHRNGKLYLQMPGSQPTNSAASPQDR